MDSFSQDGDFPVDRYSTVRNKFLAVSPRAESSSGQYFLQSLTFHDYSSVKSPTGLNVAATSMAVSTRFTR